MPNADVGPTLFHGRLSRRTFVRGATAAIVLGHAGSPAAQASSIANTPGKWRTWVLDSGDELRPEPPQAPTEVELDELRQFQRDRTIETISTIETWASGPAVLPWSAMSLDLVATYQLNPVRAARALALLHVAIADTVVAIWDAKTAYPRPAPSSIDHLLNPLGSTQASPSTFPSEHAAVAAAAASVLAYLFPNEPAGSFTALSEEAAISRLWAGTNVRSDIDAGQKIGRAVGERVIARAKTDGSDAVWDGSGRPKESGYWQPTPPAFIQQPAEPLAGHWMTWVLPDGSANRPPPPPVWGSPSWQAELSAVQEAVARRTPEQEEAVYLWAGGPGTVTPAGLWTQIARDQIERGGLDLPHAARALALTTVAMADGFICCWDAKYSYWSARPITADPTLNVLIPTPPFPSYTSGHSTISTAAATVLGHLFPAEAVILAASAEEARNSRLWAGIHFPLDNDMGATGGGIVGRLVIARALDDEEA